MALSLLLGWMRRGCFPIPAPRPAFSCRDSPRKGISSAGVSANVLSPGIVRTEILRHYGRASRLLYWLCSPFMKVSEALKQQLQKQILLGRMGRWGEGLGEVWGIRAPCSRAESSPMAAQRPCSTGPWRIRFSLSRLLDAGPPSMPPLRSLL